MSDQALSQLCDQVRELLDQAKEERRPGLAMAELRESAPFLAAALLKLREENERLEYEGGLAAVKRAEQAEHKLQLISAIFDATSIPDGLRLKRVHAIATSVKGE